MSYHIFAPTVDSTAHLEPNLARKIAKLSYDLFEEVRKACEDSILSQVLRDEMERLGRDIRREIVRKVRNNCAPLFIACRRGCVPIAEYLITVCEADVEQRGYYEVPDDRTFHYVTPLWCAVVSGNLPMVKYLIRIGCDINAPSDSGSTPVRSACYMTYIDIVQYLVERGADIKKPNMNGGTCLINSVQSPELCLYLIKKGADVNAKDIQDKTALHYAIQEHRLETTKLLLEHGADPFAVSRYGEDALRTACLRGSHDIFDYLTHVLSYSAERLAESHELIGSTCLEEQNESRLTILHWRLAYHIRAGKIPFIAKQPQVPLRPAYRNAVEFTTIRELDNMTIDIDALRIQSLLICERILGITHKDMLFRLTFRGAAYADSLQFQRCVDLWSLVLEIRVNRNSILHFDTCFAAQSLVRLMLELYEDVAYAQLPLFSDVFNVFRIITANIETDQNLLTIRPVHRKQQENFDRIMKCIAHLIYLLINTAQTNEEKKSTFTAVRELVRLNISSACTCDTFLHLCVSRLNVIKSGYLTDENNLASVFPNAQVIKLLLDCNVDVNVRNEAKSTPLHVAAQPYNFNNEVISMLLEHGADLDIPNKSDERPFHLIVINPTNTIPLMKYITLKCLAASVLSKYKIPYRNDIPKALEQFVKEHES